MHLINCLDCGKKILMHLINCPDCRKKVELHVINEDHNWIEFHGECSTCHADLTLILREGGD